MVDINGGLVELDFSAGFGGEKYGGADLKVGTKRKVGESYDEVVVGLAQRPVKTSKVLID